MLLAITVALAFAALAIVNFVAAGYVLLALGLLGMAWGATGRVRGWWVGAAGLCGPGATLRHYLGWRAPRRPDTHEVVRRRRHARAVRMAIKRQPRDIQEAAL